MRESPQPAAAAWVDCYWRSMEPGDPLRRHEGWQGCIVRKTLAGPAALAWQGLG